MGVDFEAFGLPNREELSLDSTDLVVAGLAPNNGLGGAGSGLAEGRAESVPDPIEGDGLPNCAKGLAFIGVVEGVVVDFTGEDAFCAFAAGGPNRLVDELLPG